MDFLSEWLQRGNYLPHGYCFTWTPGLLWSMVGADAVTAAAYYSIPVALVSFVRRRPDMSFSWVLWLFSAFIFACGTTHLMSIWTIWQPDYGLEAMVKLFTAAISIVTAVLLWPLIPKALKIPSVQALQAVVASLEAEVQQRRSVEQSLADVQESLAITLASIGAGFITTDRAGRITRMNPVAEQLTGWPVSEALGRDFWDVWVREGAPESHRNRNTVDLLLADSALQDSARRVVVVSRQGQRTSVEMKASLTFDGNGAARGMAMVLRDLSGVERAEVQANQLAAIVESSDDAIVGKTLQGQIISWNRGAQALFGYAADEIIGQPVATLIPPERMPEETALLARLAEGERIAPFDTQRRRKDGTLVDVSITVSPVRDAQGRIVAASKIARDISARHRHEALRLTAIRLEAENRQVQEANRLKSDFLANMSHELRTPLNAIIGFAELLHAGALPAESPKYRDFLGHIGTSGRHLLQLINDLLDLSKVESGKFEFFPEPIDLPRVVAEVVDILHGTAARGSLTLTTEIDPALTGLVLDPARLKQVLYNYLSNAIKFTPPGGRVTLRATTHGDDAWRIEVEDTGIGIAADDLNRLFAVFQQLDSGYTKRHAGTGLGLALTRRLAEEQGGSVGVRSEPGRGSVFHVTLPRVVPGAQRRVIDRAPLPPLAGNALRVLVIEDEPQDQARIVAALEHAGLQAVPASTAAQALGHAAGESFAAITLDLLLPDGSGLEVLAAIRNEGPNRETPVIVVTMVTDHNAVAGFAVADVLGKPIRPDEVVAALRKCDLVRQPRARVLVIDDERASLDLMAATLEQAGIDALCRQDARQALEELDTLRPDAIILDLMMPGFDGFATLDALRALPPWAATPVFVWTSLQLSQAEYERLAQSAQAILHKGQGSLAQMVERLRVHAPVRQMVR